MVVPPTVPGVFLCHQLLIYMMQPETQPQTDEPVGIVISRGWEPETTPRFSAYVWAPFPEDELERDEQAA